LNNNSIPPFVPARKATKTLRSVCERATASATDAKNGDAIAFFIFSNVSSPLIHFTNFSATMYVSRLSSREALGLIRRTFLKRLCKDLKKAAQRL